MAFLFWEADRDFGKAIFEILKPVCEPQLLVFILHCSDSFLKHFYFSHPEVLWNNSHIFGSDKDKLLSVIFRGSSEISESEVMLYHTHIKAVFVPLHV